jgi:5-methylcytosine-specific restriction protein A
VTAFSPATREAICIRDEARCALCGDLTRQIQHRRARGMGGTVLDWIGNAANGVLLCGSGTTGCHGAIERNPELARALGYRLDPGEDPELVPVWYEREGFWRLLSHDQAMWRWDLDRQDPDRALLDALWK